MNEKRKLEGWKSASVWPLIGSLSFLRFGTVAGTEPSTRGWIRGWDRSTRSVVVASVAQGWEAHHSKTTLF